MDTTVISILDTLKLRDREVIFRAQGHRARSGEGGLNLNPSILALHIQEESALRCLVYLCEL